MEHVEFVHGQFIEVFLDEIHPEEMAADVEVHAPVFEAGRILDAAARDVRLAGEAAGKDGVGHQLEQRLEGIERSVGCGTPDGDAFGRDLHHITFAGDIVATFADLQVILLGSGFRHAQVDATGQVVDQRHKAAVAVFDRHGGRRTQAEGSLAHLDFLRLRQQAGDAEGLFGEPADFLTRPPVEALRLDGRARRDPARRAGIQAG